MYHVSIKGNPYEAGFKWGRRLYDQGMKLLDQVPFVCDEERKRFAFSCDPLYRRYVPGIVEEIKGIADGQKVSYNALITVLYSMYCIMPDQRCTCFIMKNEQAYLLCRNSDFLANIPCTHVKYQIKGRCAFSGNTTAFVEIEDGMNEHRVAIGLTAVYPKQIRPGLNAGMLVRYLLENACSTADALDRLKQLPIASAQTFTVIDAQGHAAVVECDCDDMEVSDESDPLVAVNAFYSEALKHKRNGAIDDWQADCRYETAVHALTHMPSASLCEYGMAVLAGQYGFLCQDDQASGKDTVWSVIYDTKQPKSLRCEGNPARKRFQTDIGKTAE